MDYRNSLMGIPSPPLPTCPSSDYLTLSQPMREPSVLDMLSWACPTCVVFPPVTSVYVIYFVFWPHHLPQGMGMRMRVLQIRQNMTLNGKI